MADIKIDDTVDITDVVCPVTFVKAKVALEELDDGQILSVVFSPENTTALYRVDETWHTPPPGSSTRTPLTYAPAGR